ncbi:RNA polymerase sigma-70 factor (plasmid) [Pedobacter sp. BS3]|uniref:RNA polymerase sigma-70 factor n=1 Tax=Pedobacter sp. BS3 TaxID=2567937 RepID=UPI0011EBE53E|nr:RNA polymerase sigma-70 factor [Pedobacter sp. BS3]TZF85997.1 RNA polymerase sigma-70 factor [Pedobacter sp. BS3]
MEKGLPHKELDLEALNRGDRHAYSQVYLCYYNALCLFAYKLVSSQQDAEDIVENLFMRLWQKQEQFENEQHLKSFLYRATKNAALNFLKTSTHANERNTAFCQEQGEVQDNYLSELIRVEIAREIYVAIKNLPPQCSKIISMSYLENMSNQEIADKMGLSVQTVKNQKMRGLSLLKHKLPPDQYQFVLLLASLSLFDLLRH